MKRLHFIELEDQDWLPDSIRDAVTDYLQFITNRTQPYAPVVERLERALRKTNNSQIIDLCSGGAGPWISLQAALQNSGAIKVVLTDKFPNVSALERAKNLTNGTLDYVTEPIDATNVPDTMNGFRTMFASFHHFAPAEATSILGDAVVKRQGIGIFEATHRSVPAVLLMLLLPVIVLVFTPLIRPFRWSRLLWTYLIPVVPFIVMFDGIVSCLRTYNKSDLEKLIKEIKSETPYRWEMGEERVTGSPLPVTYLIGYPDARSYPTHTK